MAIIIKFGPPIVVVTSAGSHFACGFDDMAQTLHIHNCNSSLCYPQTIGKVERMNELPITILYQQGQLNIIADTLSHEP